MAKADDARMVARASAQLDRVLGFFPRVDSKITALFAANTTMLGLLALNIRATDVVVWYLMALHVVTAGLLAGSLVLLYLASFPQMKGGAGSLVYFREIGRMTEEKYVAAVNGCDDERYARELESQVWRNSEILTEKFERLKQAFYCTAAALAPWLAVLAASSLSHSALVVK